MDAVLAAVRRVLENNPEISDLILQYIGFTNPDYIDDILAEVSSQLPDQAEELAEVASNIQEDGEFLGFFESESSENGQQIQPNSITPSQANESEETPPPYSGGSQPN